MADNVLLNAGTGGDTVAADDIAGVKHQRVKIEFGADGSATDVSSANPLPITLESGGIAGRAEDSAHASGQEGVVILAVRRDSASSGVDTDGDYAALSVTSDGSLRVSASAVIPGTAATSLGKAEDAAHTSGDVGVMALAVRQDTLGTLSSASGDYEPIHLDASGRVYANAQVTAQATGGATPGRILSAASTNGTVVKASAGTLYMLVVTNTNAAVRYLKVYNSTSVTVGTTTPTWTIAVPGATTGGGVTYPIPACGIAFGTGICFALTSGVADNDTGAVAANELCVNYAYS